MTLAAIEKWLGDCLDLSAMASLDSSLNGLQVGSRVPEVSKVAFAVDAAMESFRRAAAWGAQLLVVHHGILWDRQRIIGNLYDRVRFLVETGLALYAAHLPLDVHPEVGNNAGIARQLGLLDVKPFGAYRGAALGCKGVLADALPLDEVVSRLAGRQGEPLRTLPFGPPLVKSVGVISGDAPWGALQAAAEGLDAYVTGEPAHEIYHHCLEQRIHAIFAGHYHSESYGVQSLAGLLARDTGLVTTYLDIPTGL
ncbi:MAG: Nif3-like dinuclear metal center hexameric protein [Spirochaetia bacterium]